jgi:hypothetical protein
MPKLLRIIAVFFTLALMCAQVAVQASTNPSSTMVFTELANAPPGHTQIAIVMENNISQVVDQPIICQQIERGVSVPYRGLINEYLKYNYRINFTCNRYYAISTTEYEPQLMPGFRTERLTNRFATDLGVRYASSVLA